MHDRGRPAGAVRNGCSARTAVTTAKRSPNLPDIPAVAETVPGFDAEAWYGLLAPAGTARTIVSALNREIAGFLKRVEVAEKLALQGFDVVGSAPLEFAAYLRSELRKWRKVIDAAWIRPE